MLLWVWVVGLGLSEHIPRTHVKLAGVHSYLALSLARAFSLGPDDDLRGFVGSRQCRGRGRNRDPWQIRDNPNEVGGRICTRTEPECQIAHPILPSSISPTTVGWYGD